MFFYKNLNSVTTFLCRRFIVKITIINAHRHRCLGWHSKTRCRSTEITLTGRKWLQCVSGRNDISGGLSTHEAFVIIDSLPSPSNEISRTHDTINARLVRQEPITRRVFSHVISVASQRSNACGRPDSSPTRHVTRLSPIKKRESESRDSTNQWGHSLLNDTNRVQWKLSRLFSEDNRWNKWQVQGEMLTTDVSRRRRFNRSWWLVTYEPALLSSATSSLYLYVCNSACSSRQNRIAFGRSKLP